MEIEHLGMSGLALRWPDATLAVDPPTPRRETTLLTWSEAERVAGARPGPRFAAAPALLSWLGLTGVALADGQEVALAGFQLWSMAYQPIPYAVPAEALRKTASALRRPRRALRRLAHTLRRPGDLPRVVRVRRAGWTVALLGQSLHRFTDEAALAPLLAACAGADVLIAGTDYEDERATGRLMGRFGARHVVLADLIGPVRRALDLPVRPLSAALEAAPPGALTLEEGERLRLDAGDYQRSA